MSKQRMLFTETPLSKAIFKFFSSLEQDILKATNHPGAYRAYLFGGCALHIHTNARGSNDIDVEINAARRMEKTQVLITKASVTYQNGSTKRILAFDTNFTPMLGPLHEDYQDDAIRLQSESYDSPLWTYVVTPEDLAVSKLGRFGAQDIDDILTLLRMKKMTLDGFYKRATEAIDYYACNKTTATGSLNHIVRLYNQSND